MNRRLLRTSVAGGMVAAFAIAGIGTASADPNPEPGTPPAGKTPSQIYAGVGADAFAELTNNVMVNYNAQSPAPAVVLASYDSINPVTSAVGENITTKPGCSIVRPNGANAAITAITQNLMSTVDPTSPCIDFVRASRAKDATKPAEANLTFYAQSRDAVGYAVIGNAYAPTTPLTTAQLKDIWECKVTDWSAVGGQAGAIHLYKPPDSAATLTFFLQAIGSNLNNVAAGCGGLPTLLVGQQNDGTSMGGDPQGILPYAVTKWAAQTNAAPGIRDLRGGSHIGTVNSATAPVIDTSLGGETYKVLNPDFTTGASTSYGRIFFNAVRNDAPQPLKDIFNAGGYLCDNADEFLIPFGNTPLGNDTGASRYCGQPN